MDKNKLLKLAKLIMQFAEIKTDKGVLIYDGELVEGTEVTVEKEDGEFVPAEDGEYLTEEVKITIAEGKITKIEEIEEEKEEEGEIEEKPVEEKPVEEEVQLSKLEITQNYFSQSYEDIERKLAELIGDCWIVEAGDGWCVAGKYDEEDWTEHYYRYTYSIEGEEVKLGDYVEVYPRFVTEAEAANLEFNGQEEIEKLKTEIEELKKQPLEEEVKMQAVVREKANNGVENKALKYFRK